MTRIEADWKIIRARDGAVLVDEGDNLRGATEPEKKLADAFSKAQHELEVLRHGLFACARESGADVSDGPPQDVHALVEWAVHCVIEMRELDEEGYGELAASLRQIAEDPANAEHIARQHLRTGNPGGMVKLGHVLEFLRKGRREDPRTGRDRAMTGWKGAADELEREFS